MKKIALVGNPNCGKTSVFNVLTGSMQYVGNWPGVTVEKKEGFVKGYGKEYKLVDLPGIYSLSPYSLEEVVARNYILEEHPDLIVNVVDVSNIERNLYLTTQLLELNVPMIAAFNMMDVIEKRGDRLDLNALSAELGIAVFPISVTQHTGIQALIEGILDGCKIAPDIERPLIFQGNLAAAIQDMRSEVKPLLPEAHTVTFSAIKLLEHDSHMEKTLPLSAEQKQKCQSLAAGLEKEYGDDIVSVLISQRYAYIRGLVGRYLKRPANRTTVTEKIDRILTNRWLALPIFFVVMWLMYFIAIQVVGESTSDGMEWLIQDGIGGVIAAGLQWLHVSDWVVSLVQDGILKGVGSVLSFVPQLLTLFFIISFLEDCGYMSRVAFIMDKVFCKFGLSGKSFIPMVLGAGCSVPGIMACRTIESEKERKMTIMLTPFIPCGAKLPVFALFVAAFFPQQSYVGPSMYLLGMVFVVLSGLVLKNTLLRGEVSPFVMELPNYHVPTLSSLLNHTWDRGKAFIIKAGTIILAASAVIWFLQSFNYRLEFVEAEHSLLSSLGRLLAPVFSPLGFGNWQAAVATLTGVMAKENIVATFGILFSAEGATLSQAIAGHFTSLSAYAFMIFTLLASPCVGAISAMRRELGSWKWTGIALCYQTGLAWMAALIFYQVGRLIAHLPIRPGDWVILGIVAVIIIGVIVRAVKNSRDSICSGGCAGCSHAGNCKL